MKFINAKPLVLDAQKNGYAVPALNTNGGTYDITRAALEAAQELKSPLILQVYEPNTEYRGYKFFAEQARFLCEQLEITVPVALQVDHGHSFESVARAMHAGLTSVMFDASHESLEKNIEGTREVLKLARTLGVSVEAEVGYVKGNEPSNEKRIGRIDVPKKPLVPPAKTDIKEAVRFVEATSVDMLAVSVGTTHGVYKSQPDIDFGLLANIRKMLDVPLVQHGTCGISPGDLARLAKTGMSKINFGEPFRFNYIKYFNELTDSMEHLWHPWRIMQEIKNHLKADIKELIVSLGAANRC
ncbi:MAG: class II fructose-bisphosphate aldolase [Lentisphaerae bacterium]|nr:class II fructose-bisphosphate aldolase [Lentisphaerota bacterium]